MDRGGGSEPIRMFQTEHEFELRLGYLDEEGTLHRDGRMRLATARDEIEPLRDPRVQRNEAFLPVILLARVVTRLGSLAQVHPGVIEKLYAQDFRFLLELYNRINGEDATSGEVECPNCRHRFRSEGPPPGGS
jgi:hypothetical protein